MKSEDIFSVYINAKTSQDSTELYKPARSLSRGIEDFPASVPISPPFSNLL